MKTLIEKLALGACTASLVAFSIGCGEMPDATTVLDLHSGVEVEESVEDDLGFFDDGQPVILAGNDGYFARGPVLEEHYVDHLEGIALPEVRSADPLQTKGDGRTHDEELDVEPDEAEKEVEEEGPFDSGCATSRDWKQLASEVCSDGEARLTQFKTAFDCGGSMRRGARFTCTFPVDFGDDLNSEVYMGLVTGQSGDCRSIEEHLTEVTTAPRCGEQPKFVEIEGLGECDASDSDGQALFERVKVVCAQ